MKRILVTGGAGFIGSALIRQLLAVGGWKVTNCDVLSYAGNLASLQGAEASPDYHFERLDIRDKESLRRILQQAKPEAVVHLAAETHVDRSIDSPEPFVQTNLVGTYTLLEAIRDYWQGLSIGEATAFRYLQVSTDEVFGSLGEVGCFSEQSAYAPRSPYSATKAGADHLAMAWHHTFGLPVLLTYCCNNYGAYQYPEKLIPSMIIRSQTPQMPLPVYGSGEQVREWLWVDDHVRALLEVLQKGTPGESYAIGSGTSRTNWELVSTLCRILDKEVPTTTGESYLQRMVRVKDRPGHDHRYLLDTVKLTSLTGWHPTISLEDGLRQTVKWYLAHEAWWRPIQAEALVRRGEGQAQDGGRCGL